LIVATITVLLAALSMLGNAAAQKDSVPKPQDKLALAENDVKHLLPLMEADRHGKVSRQEVHEVYGRRVRQIGQGEERRTGCQGSHPIEFVGQPFCRQVVAPSAQLAD
jgi:hypothetical protein